MACQTPNLGAALTAMGACPASPLQRNWILADRVSASRSSVGATVYADLQSVPVQDPAGRFAHVRAIRILGSVALTIPGATNDAVAAYTLRSLINSIYLTDNSGHEFLSALEGRDLVDDGYFRGNAFRLPEPLVGGVTANVGAGTFVSRIDTTIDLVGRGPDSNAIEGLVLLASLQKRGQQAFRFRLGSEIAGAPAGMTVAEYRNPDGDAGLWIQLDVVYLEAPVLDAPWCLRNYTVDDQNGTLWAPEAKHEYIVARGHAEDSWGADFSEYDGISVSVGSANALAGATQVESFRRDTSFGLSAPLSAAGLGSTDLELPNPDAVSRSVLILLPPRARQTAPAGPVSFRYASRGAGVTSTRYLHRYTLCESAQRAQTVKMAVTSQPCGVQQLTPAGMVQGIVDSTAPKFLDV